MWSLGDVAEYWAVESQVFSKRLPSALRRPSRWNDVDASGYAAYRRGAKRWGGLAAGELALARRSKGRVRPELTEDLLRSARDSAVRGGRNRRWSREVLERRGEL